MKKVNLNNLYESPYPPTDINTLWVDKDESTGKIRAIHKYNIAKGEWEPDMVSVDYMKPTEPESERSFMTYTGYDDNPSFSWHVLKSTDSGIHCCIVNSEWTCDDSTKEFLMKATAYELSGGTYFRMENNTPVTVHSDSEDINILGGALYNTDVSLTSTDMYYFYIMTESQYEAFRQDKTEQGSVGYSYAIIAEITKK